MKRQLGFAAFSIAVAVIVGFVLGASTAGAALVTYVDATEGTGGNTTLLDGSVFDSVGANASDDRWRGREFANDGTIFETNAAGGGGEDAPMLLTTISGLTPGANYNIFGYFWSDLNNWRLKGTLDPNDINDNGTPGDLSDDFLANDPAVSFSRNGTVTSANAPALATGVDGGDNLGVTYTGSGDLGSNTANWTSDIYFASPTLVGEGNRALYQVSFGTTVADGSGQILVYIDDQEHTSQGNRTWYDGVGYSIPEPSTFALLGLAGLLWLVARRRGR